MKKQLAVAVLACGILAVTPAYAATMNGVDTNSETKFEFENGIIEFVGYDIIKDYNGNDIIAMQYNFTNTSTESHTSLDIFGTQVFQDSGIEVDSASTNDEEWQKLNSNLSKTVKPGVTISTAFIYELESTTSPVEIIVKDWDNYNDDHTIMIDISKYNDEEGAVAEAVTETVTELDTEKKEEETVSTEAAASTVSDADYSALQEEKETLESENAELQDKVKELEAENASLKDQLEKAETTETETETETEVSTEIVGLEYTDVAVVRIVQQALNTAGFDCGTPDGLAGTKTTEAIKAYQTKNNINVNGVITDELLESLGVADQVTEAAKIEAQKAEYSTDYTYEQLARNPDTYEGDKVTFKGKVLQAGSFGDDYLYVRLAANSDYDTVLFITYSKNIIDFNILEDDIITIYGTSTNTYSYKTVRGDEITIPWVHADIIELN